jgi:uncharacterized protein
MYEMACRDAGNFPTSSLESSRMTPTISTLILPGLGDSGPEHWQSQWEDRDPTLQRVVQTEWDAPRRDDWVTCLDTALLGAEAPVVLVAHSSACLLVAHWAVGASPARHAMVRAALLVAPSDPGSAAYPAGPQGFAPVPLVRLPFPSIVVASDDDPYVSAACARTYAQAWGSRLVQLAGAGHVNAASGHGPWPEGWALLEELRALPDPDPSLPPWLASEERFDAFLAAFVGGTFPIAWWTHGAHVAMAASVLWSMPVRQALTVIRERIKCYNVSQGGQNTESSGYHETLTRLWIGAVASLLATLPDACTRLEAARRAHHAFARRSSLFRGWYDTDLLKHNAARRDWVAPDPTLAGAAAELFPPG